MLELLKEFKELRKRLDNNDIPLERAIFQLAGLLEKLNGSSIGDYKVNENIISDFYVQKLVNENSLSEKRIIQLYKILVLQQLGFNFSEEEITLLLSRKK